MTTLTSPITESTVPTSHMTHELHQHFGTADIVVESTVYAWLRKLSPDYDGGFWEFHTLSNGGFFMQPVTNSRFQVDSPNGASASMTARDAGITATLFALSHISFHPAAPETISRHFELLHEYLDFLPERSVADILRITD